MTVLKPSSFIVAGLLALCSTQAAAKWTINDQIRMITGRITSDITALKGQIASIGAAAVAQQAGLSVASGGPVNPGVYAVVGRANDIFTFCEQGVPTDFWIGVNPTTGQYQITNWWAVNPRWIPYYVTLCPFGGPTPGRFMAGNGAAFKAGPTTPLTLESPVPPIPVPLIPFPH
jgi:hypothetical protein